MAIQLQSLPPIANAALTAEDIQAIAQALSGVVTLPQGKSFSDVLALNITIQPSGAGVLNVRFSK